MKKFINRPQDVVEEMLQGLVVLHPGCVRLPGHKALIRADAQQARGMQVAVLSGGGSGHEPAHAGYIGQGMLSAAIAGEVFTSPSSDTVFAAIQAVAGKSGALLVVKNYTGDRLNFGLAAEMARAEGIPVEMIIVDDDVALSGTEPTTGARGLAGTIFIHKLVGAAAAEGRSLAELVAIGRAAVGSMATMGVSFSAGTSPAVGRPSFELGEREMELGLGIHGEPGVKRMQLQAADELTETLLSAILQQGKFAAQKPVAAMINNLGATTEMELAIVARHAVSYLESKGFTGGAGIRRNLLVLTRHGRNLDLGSGPGRRASALARCCYDGARVAQRAETTSRQADSANCNPRRGKRNFRGRQRAANGSRQKSQAGHRRRLPSYDCGRRRAC